ncbi:unnamed protein product [Cochlearia groenlandica]
MNNFIVFLLLLSLSFKLNESCKRNHVVIHNQLAPNKLLNINCRADDGKIRKHDLMFNATPYIIDFKDKNWPDDTSWHCVLLYGPKLENVCDFEAYHVNFQRCGQLRSWIARLDGIWFTREYKKPPGWVLPWRKR